MPKKIEVELDTYYWFQHSGYVDLMFRRKVSVKTIRKWLNSDKEYRELKQQLKEKEKQYKKLYRKVLRKAVAFIKRRHPEAVIKGSYVGIPTRYNALEYRLVVEFKPNGDWWVATREWTFGGKRMPELSDDIKKIVKLGDEIIELRKKLNEVKFRVIRDHVKKWIMVVK